MDRSASLVDSVRATLNGVPVDPLVVRSKMLAAEKLITGGASLEVISETDFSSLERK